MRLLLAILLAVVGLSVASPASAGDTTSVLSPTPGSTVRTGFHTVVVELVGEPAGTYHVSLIGCDDNSYYRWVDFEHDGSADAAYSLEFEPIGCDDTFLLYLYRGTFGESEWNQDMEILHFSFRVLKPDPPPEIAGFTTSPRVFYPTIVDGFRDRTEISWQSPPGAEVGATVEIYNAGGTLVNHRTWDPWQLGYWNGWEAGTWNWNGRTTGGRLVAPGSFGILLRLTNNVGQAVAEFKHVEVRRGVIDRKFRFDRQGVHTSRRVSTTGCGFRDLDAGLRLACRGGDYAVAKYFFDLPIDAYSPSWWVDGRAGCCRRGEIRRWGGRFAGTGFFVKVRVTEHRSYTVFGTHVEYHAMRLS